MVIVRPGGRALVKQCFSSPNKSLVAGKKWFTKVYIIARVPMQRVVFSIWLTHQVLRSHVRQQVHAAAAAVNHMTRRAHAPAAAAAIVATAATWSTSKQIRRHSSMICERPSKTIRTLHIWRYQCVDRSAVFT